MKFKIRLQVRFKTGFNFILNIFLNSCFLLFLFFNVARPINIFFALGSSAPLPGYHENLYGKKKNGLFIPKVNKALLSYHKPQFL